jgi:hypothetical protein
VLGARVREVDPQFFARVGCEPLGYEEMPEGTWSPRRPADGSDAALREFDAALGERTSKLVDYSPRAEHVVADAYRAVMGLTEREASDAEALDRLLNPARNRLRLETLNDSQDQRHRMVPASRPLMLFSDRRTPDYILPMLIRENPRARQLFEQAVDEAWRAKNELLDRGVPREFALYLLPNATAVRFLESGALIHLIHKWTMRTCFNAQEEIYQASMEEIEQVRPVHPQLMKFIGPPCYVRAGQPVREQGLVVQPICTEGSHFCGIKVWETFPRIERKL